MGAWRLQVDDEATPETRTPTPVPPIATPTRTPTPTPTLQAAPQIAMCDRTTIAVPPKPALNHPRLRGVTARTSWSQTEPAGYYLKVCDAVRTIASSSPPTGSQRKLGRLPLCGARSVPALRSNGPGRNLCGLPESVPRSRPTLPNYAASSLRQPGLSGRYITRTIRMLPRPEPDCGGNPKTAHLSWDIS